ncbi:MAG: two-component system, OmpR family, sensor histidine kinase BraS/BceS [Clostridiales bacterium]|nr:two-component system, OmpR family, sensor histidine kinase BraS/BceS [Clostridiales bacterium]
MGEKRNNLFFEYIKRQRWVLLLSCLFLFLFCLVFYLGGLSLRDTAYAFSLCIFFLVLIGGIGFYRFIKRHQALLILQKQITLGMDTLPIPFDLIEEDYQNLLLCLQEENRELRTRADLERQEMLDYYTTWVHQIKTPIAALRLLLQAQENQDIALLGELFKVEEYVMMVLTYLRLGGGSSDFVFGRYSLSDLVRQTVRKYARLFIQKKIQIELGDLSNEVLTDEKWFLFLIEQILSNALKYTSKGSIRIYLGENEKKEPCLIIEDTGIGIEREDLPRVFEKGFTGYNGRMDKKSTGIGLFLCKQIADKLGHTLAISSRTGVGTRVMIGISNRELPIE